MLPGANLPPTSTRAISITSAAAQSLAGALRVQVCRLHQGYLLGRSEASGLRAVDMIATADIG